MDQRTAQTGKVYLIGAGPGDPELLTLKAARAIASSDVIFYDDPVNPEVLTHARRGVELVYVGKRADAHSRAQADINRMLVERARRGQTVGRIKGGDPFIFGRGGEEAIALAEASINWEVVPGISSGAAAAAYAGIPLTHRDHSSSVAFITGHQSQFQAGRKIDWAEAARLADTLVIFMCAGTIAAIARALVEGGRAPSTPMALIRWATYDHQEVYAGTLEELINRGEIKIETPAIAIIGAVAALEKRLRWFGRQSLYRSLKDIEVIDHAVA
jgi:uroporphyrin-III C-methyltransferase